MIYTADKLQHTALTTTFGGLGNFAEVRPATAGRNIEFSSLADDANALVLSSSELQFSTPLLKVGSVSGDDHDQGVRHTGRFQFLESDQRRPNHTASGVITINTLNVSSASTVDLTTATNSITRLGTINTSGQNFSIHNAGALDQTGIITAGTFAATLDTGILNLGTQTNAITNLGAITAPGGFYLANGNTPLNVTGAISTHNNPVSINAGTGTYTQNDVDISSGTGALTIIADDVAINANTGNNAFVTSGALTLKPATAARNMTLGADAGSQFALNSTEITNTIGGVTGTITIGDSASTGQMTIGGATNFSGKTLNLNAGSFSNPSAQLITASTLALNAHGTGDIGSSLYPINVTVTPDTLAVNTQNNKNAFINVTSETNLNLNTSNVGSGILSITAGGDITQSGVITTGGLSISNTGNINLNTQTNAITNLGAITAPGGLFLKNGNALTIGDAVNMGANTATIQTTTGNITLNNTITSTAEGGNAIVLASGAGFINNAGASALKPGSGRWLIYSADPANNTFGNQEIGYLNSDNSAVWNTASLAALGEVGGNHYVFSYQPIVTFTSTSLHKDYGTDATAAVASAYTVSGIHPGITGAFQADTNMTAFSGTPSVTSAGSGVEATVAPAGLTLSMWRRAASAH